MGSKITSLVKQRYAEFYKDSDFMGSKITSLVKQRYAEFYKDSDFRKCCIIRYVNTSFR